MDSSHVKKVKQEPVLNSILAIFWGAAECNFVPLYLLMPNGIRFSLLLDGSDLVQMFTSSYVANEVTKTWLAMNAVMGVVVLDGSGLEKNLFGNHSVSLPTTEMHSPPRAFASDPLMHVSATGSIPSVVLKDFEGCSNDIVEIEGLGSAIPSLANQQANLMEGASPAGPGATTRKSAFQVDWKNSETLSYDDDGDGNQKKYTRRGNFRHKFLRALLPFWSSALPTLPVTAPPRKGASNADDVPKGRVRHQRPSRMDPRKILFIIAIMACMATMGILYYRLAQRGPDEDLPEDEQ
ncbi:hypothetical protein U1Q18_004059 [Sarracenia purpurea var. burkii]